MVLGVLFGYGSLERRQRVRKERESSGVFTGEKEKKKEKGKKREWARLQTQHSGVVPLSFINSVVSFINSVVSFHKQCSKFHTV